MEIAVAALAGLVGLLLTMLWLALRRGHSDTEALQETLREELQSMTQATLSQASEQLLTLANERLTRETESSSRDLESKKRLIDQQLQSIKTELERVTSLVHRFEKDREAKFGELTAHLEAMGKQTQSLAASTATLREALSSSRVRGQWGERMADDILRLIGLVEGINYYRQQTLEGDGSRPDFVFLLPGELRLNMDVKFPLDNYLRFLEADSVVVRDQFKNAFLRDVRNHIRNLATRAYIDPEGGTVDYVLLFIPNESIYSFIHESDHDIVEFSLGSKVLCCSPLTLFAILSIVRQTVDNFALRKASEEIIGLIGRFDAEWGKFIGSLEVLGRRLGSTQNAYDEVMGPRRRRLEQPLKRIEALRQQQEIAIGVPADDGVPILEGTATDHLDPVV